MPRQARRKSESGIYHVLLRGINQQQIFEDNEDFEKFLQVLKDCKAISEQGTQGTVLCVDRIIKLGTQGTVLCVDRIIKLWYSFYG